jgi:hypothetical protein
MAKNDAKSRPVRKTPPRASHKADPDEAAYTQSLIEHGQAVKLPAGGTLPPGATHELVEDDQGQLRAVRRRFSAL